MVLYYTYLLSLLASAIYAFHCRKWLAGRFLSAFVPMLWIIFLQELAIFICVQRWPDMKTGVIYNFYGLAITLFFSVHYYLVPFNKPFRKIIAGLVLTYALAYICTFLFFQSVLVYNSYLVLSGGFVIDCLGLLFLFNYFRLDDVAEEEHWRPFLWITIGAVIYYPVVNISFALYKHLLAYKATFFGVKLYRVIPQTMSIFMYSCFIYAFYLCKKKN